jgi:hypothetical protein
MLNCFALVISAISLAAAGAITNDTIATTANKDGRRR